MKPIEELQEMHYSSWISLTQLLHVVSVASEVDFNLAFQLGRPKPLRKMEPSCLGSICRLPMIGFKVKLDTNITKVGLLVNQRLSSTSLEQKKDVRCRISKHFLIFFAM